MRTNEELKRLAFDIHAGKVFTDRHLQGDTASLPLVFMPLVLMDAAQIKDLADNSKMVFEYNDKAGKLSVNGYPTFFSMQYLNQEEFDILVKYHTALKEALDKIEI